MAIFQRYEVHSPQKAWNLFEKSNGYIEYNDFFQNFDITNKKVKIGCLILDKITFFDEELFLEDCYIYFPKNIQQGRQISLLEENNILALLLHEDPVEIKISTTSPNPGFDIEKVVKTRANQYIFRNALLKLYDKCVLCGIKNKKVLKASHSKPWAQSDSIEKTNPNNGLLLCANHDSLYDNHMITFNSEGKILIANSLSDTDKKLLNISDNMKINVSKETLAFIEEHRKVFNSKNNI